MKKYWALVFGVALLAFAWITYSKRTASNRTNQKNAETAVEGRERITSFWQAYHQATRLRVDGLFSEATAVYQKALQFDPIHEESLYYLGNCLFELGDYDASLAAYRRLVDLNPESQRGYSQIGMVLSSFLPGSPLDLEGATEAFQMTVEINREQSGPFLQLGRVALQRGDLTEALAHFETAAGFRSPEGYYLAAYVLFRQGRYTKSLEWCSEVFQLHQKEKAISGRGLVSEGDLETDGSNRRLSPLDTPVGKSILLASWAAERIGGYRDTVDEEYRYTPEKTDLERLLYGPILSGPGRGAWSDFDGDGDLDLVSLSPDQPPVLLRNQKGQMTEVVEDVGLEFNSSDWDACWGDFDADGDQDLYVIRAGFTGRGQNSLFQNLGGWESGSGRFRNVTEDVGLIGSRSTWRSFFIDFDMDKHLDLVEAGRPSPDFPSVRIFRNLSGDHFQEDSNRLGIDFKGNAVDIAPGDYDGDGDTDLYVMRWHRSGILYRNEHHVFTDQTEASNLDNTDGNGLSALFLDYNRDGRQDLLITAFAPYDIVATARLDDEFRSSGYAPRLFQNGDAGVFVEVSQDVALHGAYGTVQAAAADLDRDGWIDLVFANGGLDPLRLEDSLVLRNEEGQRFSEVCCLADERSTPSPAWGCSRFERERRFGAASSAWGS